MRGHIGYKIRRISEPVILITQFAQDVLTYDQPEQEARLTQLNVDTLTYDVPEPNSHITQFAVDVLTY